MNINEARRAMADLHRLATGTPLTIRLNGKEHTLLKQESHSEMFGHSDSRTVKFGYGPGYWNVDISADKIAAGYIEIV